MYQFISTLLQGKLISCWPLGGRSLFKILLKKYMDEQHFTMSKVLWIGPKERAMLALFCPCSTAILLVVVKREENINRIPNSF